MIIYGHNSYDNKTPFNKLANFLDYNYYLLHPTIKFTTEFFSDVYQIFSVYSTKTDYFHTNIYFNDDNSYLDHLKKLKERSIYNIDIDLTNSKTLILQTCLNNKTILIISAIKIGEANESISINPVYGKNLPNDSILIISFKDIFGQTIKEDIILEGHINEEYRIKEYDIKGYTLKEIIGNKSGIFLKNKSNITYIYEPDIPATSITKIELLTSIITLIFILILKKC